MDIPSIFIPAGPMINGNFNGQTLGSGSDAFKSWDDYRVGNIGECELLGVCGGIARSAGTCMTMGTASTMTSIVDTMGLTIPGASSIPAVDTNHNRMCAKAGKRIVDMVWEDLKPSDILTKESFENGIVSTMALGGSTNSIIHLIALARRANCDIGIEDFDRISKEVPVIANIRPSGKEYLMEDFYYAGGILGMLSRLRSFLNLNEKTVMGNTLDEAIGQSEVYNNDVICHLENPVYGEGSLAVLQGNLAPDSCVIKASACDPKFLRHSGKAIVFDDYASLKKFTDDENADVTENDVLVLRNAGPKGGPGMPEWGMLPLPKKMIRQGVRDMLRISDARMSGTSYGSCILHVAPESYVGGPLALIQTGDIITVDIPERSINVNVSTEEMEERRANWVQPTRKFERGFGWLFLKHIQQADEGCDFDFLQTNFGAPVKEPEIF
ncbi:dihydroxy-acid dehydratase [Sporosarcina sp. NCCP-2331]|nr:dihydroxy-acid dehydratase [Sporosarcina sp. NCCP-2331]GLB56081.1 dihydroxy-acid dehydratase [Sporosarcina sp. NCCP-2378]